MFHRATRKSARRLAAWATGTALGLTAATALGVSAAAPASAATGWAEPGAVTMQSAMLALETTAISGVSTSICDPCTDEYRQLLDIGHISGGGGDDILGITASGQLRLYPGSYPRPSSKYLTIGGGWQTYNQVTVIGDLSGDGRADLMARDTHGRLWYYASQDSLSQPFRGRVDVGYGWNIYDQLIGAANFDGSARGSLVARDLQGRLWLYDGRSNGALSSRRQIGKGWNIYNQLVGLDRNQDGVGDIVARTETGTLYVYAGNGAGGYASRATDTANPVDWAGTKAVAGEGHQPGFGKNQVLGRMSDGTAYAYQGRGDSGFFPRQGIAFGYDPVDFPLMTSTVAFGDDGAPGLVVTTKPGKTFGGMLISLFGEGSDVPPLAYYSVLAGPGDLDGDGHGDLVARDTGGHLWFVKGRNDGSLATDRRLIGGGWNIYRSIVGAGDLTGDGVADIVAATPAGDLYLYAGQGNGAFAGRVVIGWGWQIYTKLAAPGDLTGDGKSDLVAVDSAGRLWLYPGLGDSHFGARVEIGTGGWNGFHDIS